MCSFSVCRSDSRQRYGKSNYQRAVPSIQPYLLHVIKDSTSRRALFPQERTRPQLVFPQPDFSLLILLDIQGDHTAAPQVLRCQSHPMVLRGQTAKAAKWRVLSEPQKDRHAVSHESQTQNWKVRIFGHSYTAFRL